MAIGVPSASASSVSRLLRPVTLLLSQAGVMPSAEWLRQQELLDARIPNLRWEWCRVWLRECPEGNGIHLCHLRRNHTGQYHRCPLCQSWWDLP